LRQKVGIGYDIHRLVQGRKLIIGGVEIPYEKGLDGHSDADVLLHAICDAILGALGKGDIGEHFPNTDERFKGISSLALLKNVCTLASEADYAIGNVDCVIQAEEPNLKKDRPNMRRCIAQAMNVEESTVNIKATTMEQLGSIGKKEGIAAFAAVLLVPKQG